MDLAERGPLIAWHQDTIVHWVDGEGFAFQPRGEVSNLVSVQAFTLPPKPDSMEIEESTFDFVPSPKAFMFPEMVNAILTIRSQVPQESELIYDQQYGLGWVDPRGWEVYFGTNVTDYDMKIIVYQNIVDRLQADGITPAIINVEHVHAPYFRLER